MSVKHTTRRLAAIDQELAEIEAAQLALAHDEHVFPPSIMIAMAWQADKEARKSAIVPAAGWFLRKHLCAMIDGETHPVLGLSRAKFCSLCAEQDAFAPRWNALVEERKVLRLLRELSDARRLRRSGEAGGEAKQEQAQERTVVVKQALNNLTNRGNASPTWLQVRDEHVNVVNEYTTASPPRMPPDWLIKQGALDSLTERFRRGERFPVPPHWVELPKRSTLLRHLRKIRGPST